VARVLVVDDEEDIRYLVRVNLELDGHDVLLAQDGREALEVARRERPDLMILDLMLPDIDGWGVLEAMKSAGESGIEEIPVIMLTAHDSEDNRIRGGIEGAIRYLGKPFSPGLLRSEVKAALDGDPEPVRRRAARTDALTAIARQEKGAFEATSSTGPTLGNLEGSPSAQEPALIRNARAHLDDLTDKQRALLEMLRDTPSVTDAAALLDVSRSNIYASLRRIGRKLGTSSVPELLAIVRTGDLLDES